MKHLLITAMIAILIGTMQAVRIWTVTDPKTRDCNLENAVLKWRCGFANTQLCTNNVMDWIYEKIDRGDKLFRNDVHAYGWDRAY